MRSVKQSRYFVPPDCIWFGIDVGLDACQSESCLVHPDRDDPDGIYTTPYPFLSSPLFYCHPLPPPNAYVRAGDTLRA